MKYFDYYRNWVFLVLLLSFIVNTELRSEEFPPSPISQSAETCGFCNRHSDSLALVQLYQFAGGANWYTKWNLNTPMDTWFGVLVNAKGCVGVLNLAENNLAGFLPNLNLPELVFLEVSNNFLAGSVPNFVHLEVIQTIDISNNFFSGQLPVLTNKLALRTFTAADNFISGTLPSFAGAPNLARLDLRNNDITGNLHPFIGNSALEEIYLQSNKLGGIIPEMDLELLKILELSNNNLFGSLSFFGGLPNLELLNLSFNNLSGNLPNFPTLGRLQTLLLNDNNFFGPLPNFGALSSLNDKLWLQNNKFTGIIPNFLGFPQLEDLNLNNNLLDSMRPLTNLPNLKSLRVGGNFLTFDDLLPNRNIAADFFEYNPQAVIGQDKVVFVPAGEDYMLEIKIDKGIPNNQYNWYKDDFLYAQTNVPYFNIENVGLQDKGEYRVEVTNPNLPLLKIYSAKTTLLLSGTSLNDLCQFAYDLTDSLERCNDFFFFDVSLDVADASCGVAGDNVWFKFMAKGPRALIYFDSSSFDRMRLALYEFGNSPCSPQTAVELACGDIINVNNLVTGREYFISVVGDGSMMHTFTLCFSNSSTSVPPLNDMPCEAFGTAPTVCRSGSTINATMDIVNPICENESTNSIWYKTRLSTGMTSLRIDLTNNTFFNDVSLMLGTFDDCEEEFTPLPNAIFCERPDIYIINGLESGVDYYIQISTTPIGSGNAIICLQEQGRTLQCGVNIECNEGPNGPIDIPVFTGSPASCYTGCNIGAPTSIDFGDNSCYSFNFPTVWYKFTTDEDADFLSLHLSSNILTRPYFGLFKSDDCLNFSPVYCKIEGAGTAILERAPIEANTTYYIAIADFYGDEGFFDICLSTFKNTSVCNVDNEIRVTSTSMGSPPQGPYQPGEEVTFCYRINYWQYISCNWLQAIVPTFGPCWDASNFDVVGQPRVVNSLPSAWAQGTWRWFAAGEAVYNVNNLQMGLRVGDPMPAGWYFINEGVKPPPILTDPNTSLGDGVQCALDSLFWEICFTLKASPQSNCSQMANCNIGFKTYTDGEIGSKTRAACLNDVSTWFNASLDCCNNPEGFPISDITICSGEQINVPLMSSDSLADYIVNVVSSVSVSGAEGGRFEDRLIQTLVNTSDSLTKVRYSVVADRDGCLALPIFFEVFVYPTPDVDFLGNNTICLGDTSLLEFELRGEPPFTIDYLSGGVPQSPLNTSLGIYSYRVDPKQTTTYTLTKVTGANGCAINLEDSVTVTVNPISRFKLDTIICQGQEFVFEGEVYTSSIQFEHLYPGANQFECDSTVEVNLIVGANYRITLNEAICAGEIYSVGNNNYDKSGTYLAVLPSIYGCDSIITLNLTVFEPLIAVDTLIINDNGTGNGIISVNISGGVPPYRYLWSNGMNTPLVQNLRGGIYSLTVTDDAECSEVFEFRVRDLTSSSISGIHGLEFKAMPIPQKSGQELILQFSSDKPRSVSLQIQDLNGRIIDSKQIQLTAGNQHLSLKSPAPPGVYWIRLTDETGRSGTYKIATY